MEQTTFMCTIGHRRIHGIGIEASFRPVYSTEILPSFPFFLMKFSTKGISS